jgi:hypothetical protein
LTPRYWWPRTRQQRLRPRQVRRRSGCKAMRGSRRPPGLYSSSNKGRIWRRQGKRVNGEGSGAVNAEPLMDKHQPACKPGSVGPRPLARTKRDGHSSGTTLARCLKQPTRTASLTSLPRTLSLIANHPRCRPYSVLLLVGFTMPVPLPDPRCALTAPFHPCPASLLSEASPGGSFSVALSLGSPPPEVIRHRMSMEPGLSSPFAGSGRPAD